MAPPNTPAHLKELLISEGHQDLVIFNSNGVVEETAGAFSDANMCEAAVACIQHTATIMKSGEKLKRITIGFEDAVYVGTVTPVGNKTYGVMLRQNQASE